jgi:hypothetical protein
MKIYSIFVYFIILHGHDLQSSYRMGAFFQNCSNASNIEVNFNNLFYKINACNEEVRTTMLKLAKNIEDNKAIIDKYIRENTAIVNNNAQVLKQIIHGEALQDINVRAAELHQLKHALIDELIHLNAYRRRVDFWQSSIDQKFTFINQKLAFLEHQEERLHALEKQYTLLKFDVNLVNLNEIKKQIDLFHNSITNIFSVIQNNVDEKVKIELEKKLNIMYGDYAFLKTEFDRFKDDYENKIKSVEDDHTKLKNNTKVVNIGLVVLFAFVIFQQYQIYTLRLNQVK